MRQPTIKFSHHYVKHGKIPYAQIDVVLLEVMKVNLEQLSECFKHFDTMYYTEDGNNTTAHYPLPMKGEFLLLMLLMEDRLIPTLRRCTPEKENYYKGLIGKTLQMVIE